MKHSTTLALCIMLNGCSATSSKVYQDSAECTANELAHITLVDGIRDISQLDDANRKVIDGFAMTTFVHAKVEGINTGAVHNEINRQLGVLMDKFDGATEKDRLNLKLHITEKSIGCAKRFALVE